MPSTLRRFILWDFPRASWQYDVIVALILAFIFLTPRDLFRDQPKPSNIVLLPSEHGTSVYWVEPELLNSVPEADRNRALERMLKARYGRSQMVVRLEPMLDVEQETKGYMAYVKP
jgi:hypothetical protein